MIHLKSEDDIAKMRLAGKLASYTLNMIKHHIKPGITTEELNRLCHDYIVGHGAVPAPLNYRGFPKSICTSINQIVCHGVPSADDRLKSGDIVGVDVTVIVDGWHGDTCRTFGVGKIDQESQKLIKITEKAMYEGINSVKVGGKISDIGNAIEKYVSENSSFSSVKEFVGHGIGRGFHESPYVPHYANSGQDIEIVPGMVFTIEPMVNTGSPECFIDNTTYSVAYTIDGGYSAQFEHTIAVHQDGTVEILTK